MQTEIIQASSIPVTLIPGDGIGPEIVNATVQVLHALDAPLRFDIRQAGLSAFEECGDPLPPETIESIRKTQLALKGPLTTPVGGGFRSVNVRLREEFSLFANLRPVKTIIPGRYDNIDIVLVRENIEGFYVAHEHFIQVGDDPRAVATSTGINTREGCRRIARFAFDYAVKNQRRKITVVHKANVLKALTGLFLETAYEVAKDYQGKIEVDNRIVDACAMQLVLNPDQFDMLLCTNLFGDILSDELAGLVGGLGMAPGANLGKNAAIFEAVHGSAPDIARKGLANPTSLLLSAAMLLQHVGDQQRSDRLKQALEHTMLVDSVRTKDLGGSASLASFTNAVIQNVRRLASGERR